jgi:hypothetical protein
MVLSNLRVNHDDKDSLIAQLLSQVSNLTQENNKLKQERSQNSLMGRDITVV